MNFGNNILRITLLALTAVVVFSSCSLSGFAKKQNNKYLADAPYDAIIVPGVPYMDTGMSRVLTARIVWAKYLYDKGYARNIIFSGGAVYTPYYEGKIMKLYGEKMGIPANHIFTETRAEHSTENVWYSIKIARKMGLNKIALATDPFQVKMIAPFMRKHCKGIAKLPINFKQLAAMNPALPDIDPATAMQKEGFVALPEREGFFKRFRGTLGKNINFNEKDIDELANQCP